MEVFRNRLTAQYPQIMDSIKYSAERRGFSLQPASTVKGHILCELCECYLEWFKGGTNDRFWEELADVVIICISSTLWMQATQKMHMGYTGFIHEWITQAAGGEYRYLLDRITTWAHQKDYTCRLVMAVVEKVVKNETR